MSVKEKAKSAISDEQKLQRFEMQNNASNGGVTATLILVLGLVAALVFGGWFGIMTLWNFTHPEFDFRLPNPAVLSAIAEDANLPDVSTIVGALPEININNIPVSTDKVQSFFDSLKDPAVDFMNKIPRADLAEYGSAICAQVQNGVSPDNVVLQFQKQLLEDYPGLAGADQFAQDLVDKSVTNLCPVE